MREGGGVVHDFDQPAIGRLVPATTRTPTILGGHDTIVGLGGDDIICAGRGNDTVDGGDGKDRIYGEAGQDRLVGGPGNDQLYRKSGTDQLIGSKGRDRLRGGAGADILKGGPGNDRLFGGGGGDDLTGGIGRDIFLPGSTDGSCKDVDVVEVCITPIADEARALLATLEEVSDWSPWPTYDRDSYDGEGWADEDGDCINTRHEVLARDAIGSVIFSGCTVASGSWLDPYNGAQITGTASAMTIDHFVPLAHTHRAGAWTWDGDTKAAFSNDLEFAGTLRAACSATNQSKGMSWTRRVANPSDRSLVRLCHRLDRREDAVATSRPNDRSHRVVEHVGHVRRR